MAAGLEVRKPKDSKSVQKHGTNMAQLISDIRSEIAELVMGYGGQGIIELSG